MLEIRIELFRDKTEKKRLRAKLYVDGHYVETRPLEKVADDQPIGKRHIYTLWQVFGLWKFYYQLDEQKRQELDSLVVEAVRNEEKEFSFSL